MIESAGLDRFRSIIAARLGLALQSLTRDELERIVEERLATNGCRDPDNYLARLESRHFAEKELRALALRLTVGETYFFRHAEQFQAFTENVLPRIAESSSRRLRILSAGSASGEEAYTLAVLVREHLPDSTSWDLGIAGVDINTASIQKARLGRYTEWSLRETPNAVRGKYFRMEGNESVLDAAVRQMAVFEERNLVEPDSRFWAPESFDVVFCRNVLMYFTPERMALVVNQITSSLRPGGFLFLGHAETLRGISRDFHLHHTHNTFYYQKREALEAESGAPAVEYSLAPSTDFPRHTQPSELCASDSWVDAIGQAARRIDALVPACPSAHRHQAPPDAPGLSRQSAVAPSVGASMELLKQERYQEALDSLDSGEVDLDVRMLRAVLQTNRGAIDKAEAECQAILAVDDMHAGAHYLLALCREHGGDLNSAVRHDQIAIYLDPTFAMPHLHLGLIYRRGGVGEAAHREFRRARELAAQEDSARILLFGGGFSRTSLMQICADELEKARPTG